MGSYLEINDTLCITNMDTHRSQLKQMERALVKLLRKKLGKNLVSLLAVGSYGNYDFIDGYSDYDVMALVRSAVNISETEIDKLSKKYSIDIQCYTTLDADFNNRIKNNNQATRFIGNLGLIKLKKQSRILYGKNVIKLIPEVKKIIQRDLTNELQFEYEHATSANPGWNIFNREPRKWINYIINMSNCLLLSKGVTVKKKNIPGALAKCCPNFLGIQYVKKAILLRQTKKVLNLSKIEKNNLKKTLQLFLEEYKKTIKPKIIIVDKNDKIIGHKKREDVKQKDIYRVSALWVQNSKGNILLAQRAFNKSHDPGKWGVAVAGTNDQGETYESNIIKETEEEIGLKNVKIIKGEKIRYTGKHNFFSQRFFATIDKPISQFKIQKSEVAAIKWFKRKELSKKVKAHPERFLKSIGNFEEIFKKNNQ
ncbi:MAG: hypothetical protein A2538_02625 [Candidatus Magasanikbacteria bacterium RIFOXYD2_FULL_41_14]|uniref:Nudix hydrolase domain-containing protein n=1 Tax=Candidatus Magasanikbacteria bacterium RIFOXYD2_FULL_41_14 TaxID=1798709 RepID=A0A1F6PC66_9BACT|nr:MAG: hypothetical protein A2538_02625 [Candidatus Magasanikbacteria bacterium RIFOXYD2_FULL_41_14]